MSPRIRLARRLGVKAWNVVGTIARPERRDWEPAVVLLAKERGHVTPELVVGELLNGRRAVASKLIAACESYGLLRRDGDAFVPTDEGLRAAQTQDVLVPIRGAWTIWAAQDPLLLSPILRVAAWDESSSARGRGGRFAASPEPLPDWVLPTAGVASVGEDGRPVRVKDFGEKGNGEAVDPGVACALELTIDGSAVATRLLEVGEVRRGVRDLPSPALDVEALSAEVAEEAEAQGWPAKRHEGSASGEWSESTGAVAVEFSDTTVPERTTLTRTVVLQDVRLSAVGDFDSATLDGIRLQPRTRTDAEAWARWRLLHSVETYATTARYENWVRQAAALFPGHKVMLPDRRALADALRGDPTIEDRGAKERGEAADALSASTTPPSPRWWQLAAPLDWGL